jgi:signal transduction histidine kinase
LIDAGQDLAAADASRLPEALAVSARRAAHFAGYRDGKISQDLEAPGVPLIAPGSDARRVGTLLFTGKPEPRGVGDPEDREALGMLAQLIAAALDRAARNKERERLLSALQDREQHLEDLVGRLFSAQEDERRYVSRELHDGVAQTATALYRRLDAEASSGDGRELTGIAKSLVTELRAVIAGLRPTALDDLGLVSAIESLADDLQANGCDVTFRSEGGEHWPAILTAPYFRIAQEALANIRKHAGGPCKVEIDLKGDPSRDAWPLTIRDHGRGIAVDGLPAAEAGQDVGIEMMRERMTALGGSFEIEPASPGVRVTARSGGAR